MTEALQEFPKVFAVLFKDLERWDPASFHGILWHWPKEVMYPVGRVLKSRKEKVDRSRFAFSDLQPITIHFDGSIDRRKVDGPGAYTMDLFFARPGDIVVAKIDLKNGAVGIVPHDWQNIIVTGHFAVYEPDRSKLLPEYLHRIIQTSFFKAHLWRNKVGAEGRKEVKLDYFESLEIPLLPMSLQQAIVDRWQKAQDEIKAASERIKRLEEHIAESALSEAGITLNPLIKRNKAFSIFWHEIERWGVEFNRWTWNLSALLFSQKYLMVTLSDVAFINPQENTSLNGDDEVSFVPMEAVSDKSGAIVSPQIRKYCEVKNGYTRFKNDDVIWAKITPCMQNGKCAVVKDLVSGIGFGSTEFHVVRAKDKNRLLPEYIWILLRLGHLRQAAQRYFIGSAGQQRVPADFLANLQIPLPTLNLQHLIVKRAKEGHLEMVREREAVERKSREIKTEIEALILGTKAINN